jgi:hypothetical protein
MPPLKIFTGALSKVMMWVYFTASVNSDGSNSSENLKISNNILKYEVAIDSQTNAEDNI